MNHQLTLSEAEYAAILAGRTYIVTKTDTTHEAGDTITLTLQGTREQQQVKLLAINTSEKVYAGWAILEIRRMSGVDMTAVGAATLTHTNRNDIPVGVGGGGAAVVE